MGRRVWAGGGRAGPPALWECFIVRRRLKHVFTYDCFRCVPPPPSPQEFDYEAPVKLLDKMLHQQAENMSQQARAQRE